MIFRPIGVSELSPSRLFPSAPKATPVPVASVQPARSSETPQAYAAAGKVWAPGTRSHGMPSYRPPVSRPSRPQPPGPRRPIVAPIVTPGRPGTLIKESSGLARFIPAKMLPTLTPKKPAPPAKEPTVKLATAAKPEAAKVKPTGGRPATLVEKRPASTFATKNRTDPARSVSPSVKPKPTTTGPVKAAPDVSAGKDRTWLFVAGAAALALAFSVVR